ncbi:hypothetical protein DXG03_001864 [Asterophora parasitica]|uniref:Pre-SET domain-containing protein n=1 Tax=Asterophora parasitica TaxID=117018 RepID=A0A9P7KCK5_9AGAR|nr:hypothetical protein DXG03_001864 [Asterophora parasitica]
MAKRSPGPNWETLEADPSSDADDHESEEDKLTLITLKRRKGLSSKPRASPKRPRLTSAEEHVIAKSVPNNSSFDANGAGSSGSALSRQVSKSPPEQPLPGQKRASPMGKASLLASPSTATSSRMNAVAGTSKGKGPSKPLYIEISSDDDPPPQSKPTNRRIASDRGPPSKIQISKPTSSVRPHAQIRRSLPAPKAQPEVIEILDSDESSSSKPTSKPAASDSSQLKYNSKGKGKSSDNIDPSPVRRPLSYVIGKSKLVHKDAIRSRAAAGGSASAGPSHNAANGQDSDKMAVDSDSSPPPVTRVQGESPLATRLPTVSKPSSTALLNPKPVAKPKPPSTMRLPPPPRPSLSGASRPTRGQEVTSPTLGMMGMDMSGLKDVLDTTIPLQTRQQPTRGSPDAVPHPGLSPTSRIPSMPSVSAPRLDLRVVSPNPKRKKPPRPSNYTITQAGEHDDSRPIPAIATAVPALVAAQTPAPIQATGLSKPEVVDLTLEDSEDESAPAPPPRRQPQAATSLDAAIQDSPFLQGLLRPSDPVPRPASPHKRDSLAGPTGAGVAAPDNNSPSVLPLPARTPKSPTYGVKRPMPLPPPRPRPSLSAPAPLPQALPPAPPPAPKLPSPSPSQGSSEYSDEGAITSDKGDSSKRGDSEGSSSMTSSISASPLALSQRIGRKSTRGVVLKKSKLPMPALSSSASESDEPPEEGLSPPSIAASSGILPFAVTSLDASNVSSTIQESPQVASPPQVPREARSPQSPLPSPRQRPRSHSPMMVTISSPERDILMGPSASTEPDENDSDLEYVDVPLPEPINEEVSEMMDVEELLTSSASPTRTSSPARDSSPELDVDAVTEALENEQPRRSTRSSRTTSDELDFFRSDGSVETPAESVRSPTPPADLSIPASPKVFGGFPSLSWRTYRQNLDNFQPKCYYAKDLPHALQDTINHWPEIARQHRGLVHVLMCAIQENTAEDEPDAPIIEIVNDVDSDPTPPWEFHYSNKMWLGDDVPATDVTQLVSCNCMGKCDPKSKTCACILRQQKYCVDVTPDFVYDTRGRLKPACVGYPIFECNDLCGCGDECRNRVVQHGRQCAVKIQKTEEKGWGVFAGMKKIYEGAFIGIYAGELLTDKNGELRGE